MSNRIGIPKDPNKEKNADNLKVIADEVKKTHWSIVPMFWMTLVILLLTVWMAFGEDILKYIDALGGDD